MSEGYERAPELASITAWGNSEPFTLESKRGDVVLIDKQGFIRYKHFGEGAYEETDRKIRQLLAEAD